MHKPLLVAIAAVAASLRSAPSLARAALTCAHYCVTRSIKLEERQRIMNVIDEASASELPRALHKSSRRSSWILALLVVCFGLCAAGAYFGTNFGTNLETILARSPAHELSPIPGLSPEDRQALLEVRSGQHRASDEIAELQQHIVAQQTDLRRMADRIEALTAQIESLQNLSVSASAAASDPPVLSPPVARPVLRPAKRAAQPAKPEGPISVGGAPLISESNSSRH
ncbi:putative coiled-coil protein SlyX [Bradyrhizobium sp. SBR1B]|nr:putative coiled-coil protein SlyX [Bradyrhizobium sp. SBR1B]